MQTVPADPSITANAAGAVTSGFGSVWVVAHRSNIVYRVDPQTNAVTARIHPDLDRRFGGSAPLAGPQGVWFPLNSNPDEMVLIDPSSNRVTSEFPVPVNESGPPQSAWLVKDGELWAYLLPDGAMQRLVQFDTTTGKALRTIYLAPYVDPTFWPELVYAFGSFWTTVGPHEVARVDPSAGKVIAVVRTPGPIGGYKGFSFDSDHLFLTQFDSTLVRIDPRTNCVDGMLSLPTQQAVDPNRPVGQLGTLMVGNVLYIAFDQGALAVVEPLTLEVKRSVRIDDQDYVGVLAYAFGSIWYPTFNHESVVRIAPLA